MKTTKYILGSVLLWFLEPLNDIVIDIKEVIVELVRAFVRHIVKCVENKTYRKNSIQLSIGYIGGFILFMSMIYIPLILAWIM